MKYFTKFLFILAFVFPVLLPAQSNQLEPCATRDGKVDWLVQYQKHPELYRGNTDTLYVPLTIHLVGESDGTGYFAIRDVREQVCVLNSDFQESAIQFYIKNVNYIANSTYNDHNWGDGGQMMMEYLVPSTINCYIVDNPAGACGYSSYNMGVALAEACITPGDHTWAHELGHYLSLPHTFFGWEGYNHDYDLPAPVQIGNTPVERVDGLNCQISGDGFCDTPPDYLNYRWFCPADGFSVTQQLDPDSIPFNTDGTFFMSYSGDNCMERFSADQIAAMRANLLDEKPDHLGQDDVLGPIDITSFVPLTPQQDEFVDNYSEVTFSWEPLENGETYYLEASIFPNFTLIIFKETTTETSVTSTSIPPNYDIYWRVTAYSNWETCDVTSEPSHFSTGELTAVNELPGINVLEVYPNPLPSGHSLFLETGSDRSMDVVIELLDLSGKSIYRREQLLAAGNQMQEIPVADLAAGIYLLRLQSAEGALSRKVVVQR